ncbi:MAG: hypothetical protein COB36_15015 [Alphaproteobacteria bacterium]|nr:MAG: hypothetical protein COB36_15015 [Alphaproteobacteria bacterium]
MNKITSVWIVAALIAPQIVYLIVAFIQSLIWSQYSDMPEFIDLLPVVLALVVMVYCLMAVNISNTYLRITVAPIFVLLTIGAGMFNYLATGCELWGHCP